MSVLWHQSVLSLRVFEVSYTCTHWTTHSEQNTEGCNTQSQPQEEENVEESSTQSVDDQFQVLTEKVAVQTSDDSVIRVGDTGGNTFKVCHGGVESVTDCCDVWLIGWYRASSCGSSGDYASHISIFNIVVVIPNIFHFCCPSCTITTWSITSLQVWLNITTTRNSKNFMSTNTTITTISWSLNMCSSWAFWGTSFVTWRLSTRNLCTW